VLSIDTLRADRLGAFGYAARPTSPNLDASARQSVRFGAAMAQRAATWPSLATMLSGLYPSGHGVFGNGYSFPGDVETLPRILQAAGYQTGAFVSNMCSAGHTGWDSFRCTSSNDARANRFAIDWAQGVDAKRPFLLWVHYFGPHPPYFNGGERAAELDPGYRGALVPRKNVLDAVMLRRQPLGDADLAHLNALYDAAVMSTDARAGELFAALEGLGRLKDTVVVVLADHGEELYEHNRYFYHSCSVYQSTLHVPLWIGAPGLLPPGEVSQPVELVDVTPTLLDLLGVGAAARRAMHGTSLVPYLERPDGGGAGKPAYSEYDVSQLRTVLADGWKLVDNPQSLVPDCVPGAKAGFYPIGRVELYDLRSDPGERRNLAEAQPAKVAELRGLLSKRFSALAGLRQKQTIPKGLSDELKSLGYVAN
jgi:arylsulfatase A-like enzyme